MNATATQRGNTGARPARKRMGGRGALLVGLALLLLLILGATPALAAILSEDNGPASSATDIGSSAGSSSVDSATVVSELAGARTANTR